jgi:hypothetical protein
VLTTDAEFALVSASFGEPRQCRPWFRVVKCI